MQTPSATTPASPSAAGREQWKSRLGFVMAAVGSAVGLGNMWRFSYTTAAHGGAAFVVLYVLMTLLLGLPLLLAEMMLGRGARRSPIRALAHFGGPRWSILGWLFVIGAFFILAYYGVIAGWTARYAVQAVLWGFGGQDALAHFRAVATGWQAAVWQLLFMGSCVLVVRGGVRRGIELLSLVLMPLLFALVVGLAVYASTLPRAAAGYRYYLQADFSALASFEVLSAAAGQAFFSLSLGMGAMLTFASYLSDDHHLPRAASVIAGADFGVAFIAGLVVFPLVFAFDLEDTVSESSIGALFITLPQAFASLEAVGRVIAVLFFVALWVGALTSAISLLEVAVASAMDGLGWSRRQATWRIGLGSAAAGVPAALSLTVLTWMDTLVGNWLLLIGAIGLCFFVGWRMPNVASEARNGAESVRWWGLWRWLLCAAVPLLLLVLIASLVRTCSASAQKPAAASHPRLSASRAAARHARTAAKGGAAPASARPPKGPTASRCQPARSEDWGALPSPLGPIGLFVHLPRQCDPAVRFPVLIALHGLGEAKKGARRGAAGWLRDYRLEDNLARLSRPTPAALAEVLGAKAAARVHRSLEAQPYRGLVIAMPYTPASLAGPRTFAHAARYADFLVDTLLPQLHARAPTRPDAVGIDGVSLGGRTALLVALHRPAAFARVGTLQAAFAPRELPKLRRLAVRAAKAQPRYLLRLLTSTRDPYRDINRKLHALLTDAGFASELRIVPGAHNYAFNRGIGGLSMLLWHRR